MPRPRKNLIFTVVGDGTVGKTAMLIVYTQNSFPGEYLPTIFEQHEHEITVDNVKYKLTLRDTAGQEEYDRMLPLNFPNTNCFLLCFSVEKAAASYENIDFKWIQQLRHYNPKTPIVLVGTKTDLRQNINKQCYTFEDGKALMRRVKAQGYVECSSKLNHGVKNVFAEAIKVHVKGYNPKTSSKPACILL